MEAQELLKDIVFVILYGVVIGLDVASALYMLLRRGNAIAPEVSSPARLRRWAAAFMLACTLSHVFWLVYALHPSPTLYAIVLGLDLLMLLPTIAGLLLSMLQDQHRPVWPMLVALIPAFVILALCIIRGDEVLYLPLSIYLNALYASMILYMYFAVRRYRRWLRDNYADLEHKEVWQSFLILAVFLLFFVMYSSIANGSTLLVYLLQIDCIIIVALLLWRVETLETLNESTPVKVSAPQAISVDIAPLLKKHCENKHLYLQHDLSLTQLAQTIGTNHYYLSQYFTRQGLTYNAYINGLRIRHFIRLYEKAVAEKRAFTAQQLAFESGYRSYSTFSAAFKQYTGKTVTSWMQHAGK